jgi:hypothetical protein
MKTDFFTPRFFNYAPPPPPAAQSARQQANVDQSITYRPQAYGSIDAFERHAAFNDFVNEIEIAAQNIAIALYKVTDGKTSNEIRQIEIGLRSFAANVESKNCWTEPGGKEVIYTQGKENYLKFAELCHDEKISRQVRFSEMQQLSRGLRASLCGIGTNNNLLSALNSLERASSGIYGMAKAKLDLVIEQEINKSIENLDSEKFPPIELVHNHTHIYSAFNNKLANEFGLPRMPEVPAFDYSGRVDDGMITDCKKRIEARLGSQLAYDIAKDYRNVFINALRNTGLLPQINEDEAPSDSWLELNLTQEEEQRLHDIHDDFAKKHGAQYGDIPASTLIRYDDSHTGETRRYLINKQPTLIVWRILDELEKTGFIQKKAPDELWKKTDFSGNYGSHPEIFSHHGFSLPRKAFNVLHSQVLSHHGFLCYQESVRSSDGHRARQSSAMSPIPEPQVERDLLRVEHLANIDPATLLDTKARTASSGASASTLSLLNRLPQTNTAQAKRIMKDALLNSRIEDLVTLKGSTGERWLQYVTVADILPEIAKLADPAKVLTPLLHGGADIQAKDRHGVNLLEWCGKYSDTKLSRWFFGEALVKPWHLYDAKAYREALSVATPHGRQLLLGALFKHADHEWPPELTRFLSSKMEGDDSVIAWILKNGSEEQDITVTELAWALRSRKLDDADRRKLLESGLQDALELPNPDNLHRFFRAIQNDETLTASDKRQFWMALKPGATYLADMVKNGQVDEVARYCELVLEECDDIDLAKEMLALADASGPIAIGDIRRTISPHMTTDEKLNLTEAAREYFLSICESAIDPAAKYYFLAQKDKEGQSLFAALVAEKNYPVIQQYLDSLLSCKPAVPYDYVEKLLCGDTISGRPIMDKILSFPSDIQVLDTYMSQFPGKNTKHYEPSQCRTLIGGFDSKQVPSLARALASTTAQSQTGTSAILQKRKEMPNGIEKYVTILRHSGMSAFDRAKILSGRGNTFDINPLTFGYLFGDKQQVDQIKTLIESDDTLKNHLVDIIPTESQINAIRSDEAKMQALQRYLSGTDQETETSVDKHQEKLIHELEQPVECSTEDLSGDIPISNIRYALGVVKQSIKDDFPVKGGAIGSILGELSHAPKTREVQDDWGYKGFECLDHKIKESSYFFWFTPTHHQIKDPAPGRLKTSLPSDATHIVLQLGNRVIVLLKAPNKEWHAFTEGRKSERLTNLEAFLDKAAGSRCVSLQYSEDIKAHAEAYGDDEGQSAVNQGQDDDDFFDNGDSEEEMDIE